MEISESAFIVTLAAVNLAAVFGLAVPLSRQICGITRRPKSFFRYYVMFLGIYFAECVAFMAGMATQIFVVGLAFVWGIVFGLWLRKYPLPRQIFKTSFFLAVYTSLPTASFGVLIVLAWLVSGNNLLDVKASREFGIPDFLPWPLNTILGFCLALVLGTFALKTVITPGGVRWLMNRGENSSAGNSNHHPAGL